MNILQYITFIVLYILPKQHNSITSKNVATYPTNYLGSSMC